MYRRPKFLEKLLEIRREMALEADYDVDLFTELARSGVRPEVPVEPGDPGFVPGDIELLNLHRSPSLAARK